MDTYDVSKLTEEDRNNIEADSFWCLSKLLDGIQDNYTFAQPGIQNKVRQLKELIERVDGKFNFSFVIRRMSSPPIHFLINLLQLNYTSTSFGTR